MLANKEIVKHSPAQFTLLGNTTKWFRPRHQVLSGDKTIYRAFTQPYRGARAATFANMAATEGPVPMGFGYQELAITYADMIGIRGGAKWNLMQELKHKTAELAAKDLVTGLLSGLQRDIKERMNMGTFLGTAGVMGKVGLMYKVTNTTSTQDAWDGGMDGGHLAGYMHVDDTQIARYNKGDVLDVFDTDSPFAQLAMLKVHGVIHGEDGPPKEGLRAAGIGPGLIVEPCGIDGTVASNNWVGATVTGANGTSFTSARPTAGDLIVRSGENSTGAVGANFHGIPDFFDTTVDIFRDGTDGSNIGVAMDREATGNEWMNPMVITPSGATSSAPVEFDPEEQLMELADNWISQVVAGRGDRKSLNQGNPGGKEYAIEISDSLLMTMEPKLLNHLANLMAQKNQFMSSLSMSEGAAKKFQAIGVDGFTGYVWQSPTLGTVACQADSNCEPHSVYILEPSSFFWVEPEGGQGIEWAMNGNSRIWPISGSTLGTPTMFQQVMAYCLLGLLCDQPQANAKIQYVCSAREAA
jgi:hypothetical protein